MAKKKKVTTKAAKRRRNGAARESLERQCSAMDSNALLRLIAEDKGGRKTAEAVLKHRLELEYAGVASDQLRNIIANTERPFHAKVAKTVLARREEIARRQAQAAAKGPPIDNVGGDWWREQV